ncbi:MAG TPA: hypothetical protein VHP30_03480, partial [Ignavibacteriales bacterium]|nr:hypothetical protein [Ignavibacteriales bacterium]
VTPNAPAAGYKSPYIQNLNIDGGGTGPVSVSILNPSEIQENAKYEAVFHSTPLTSKGTGYIPGFRTISYDIVRTVGTTVDTILTDVDSTTFGEGKLGNPFDGLALTVTIPIDSVIVDSLTGWTIGNSNLSMAVTGSGTTPAGNNKKYWPGDYEINFTGEKTNPSTGRTIPTQDDTYPFDNGFKVNFTVKNTLTGEQLLPFVYDNNGDGVFSVGDDFAIVEYEDINNNGILEWNDRRNTWKISYTQGPGTSTIAEPVAGDQFVIKTTKPFFEGDKISFIAKAAKVDAGLANTQLNKINVVPNPYIGAAGWERKSAYSTGHGERKIDFINLPSSCTIRIFTIAGALVKTIVKESSPMDGAISWNLVSDDGMDIAYGLYVYHVDAPGIGEYIGKFAVIK